VRTPHQAIEFFRYDSSLSDEEKKKANELKLPCHLNYAACALKLKEWRLAKENCDKVRAAPPLSRARIDATERRRLTPTPAEAALPDRAGPQALAIEANNVKALFRRAQAYLGTFDHELAQKDLVAAAKLEPANKDIRDLIRKIQDDLKAQTQREKQVRVWYTIGAAGRRQAGTDDGELDRALRVGMARAAVCGQAVQEAAV